MNDWSDLVLLAQQKVANQEVIVARLEIGLIG